MSKTRQSNSRFSYNPLSKSVVFLLALILTLTFASCENPWMADILDPLLNPTVTFDSNGGTPVASIKVPRGSAIDTPPLTEKEGFYFTGWHLNRSFNNPVSFPYTVNEKATLYAGWTNTAPIPVLDFITAVYTQGAAIIYPSTPRDNLKANLVVTAHFTNGSQTQLNADAYTLSGTLTAGTSTITVNYNGKTAAFAVTVSQPELLSIEASYNQVNTIVYTNTPLDNLKSGLTVTAYYSDGASGAADVYTLSGTLTAGTSTITVNYNGKTSTFTVTVSEAELLSISASYNQGNTIVYTNTPLDNLKSGLTVTAYYSDGASSAADGYTLSGTLTAGTSTITATYNGKTSAFTVTVSEAELLNISASYNQGNTIVYTNTPLDNLKSGLTVTAYYSDGASGVADVYTLSGTLAAGTSTITANYDGQTAAFDVNVTQATYSIFLSQTSAYTFPAAAYGYGVQTALEVTVSNTGNQPTGALTVALSGANQNNFSVSQIPPAGMAVSGSSGFTVTPNTGLAPGTHTATVTVTGGNGITASFNVSFTVNFTAVTGITLTSAATKTAGTSLTLAGTVAPAGASFNTITWSIVNAGGTGASITGGNTLNTANAGTVTVRATIANGAAVGTSYTQDFTITVQQSASFNITYTQITDSASGLITTDPPIIISRTGADHPIEATLNVPDNFLNVNWYVDNANPAVPGTTGSGTSFTLDALNPAYNGVGDHSLTLEVITTGGIPYNKTINFTVAP